MELAGSDCEIMSSYGTLQKKEFVILTIVLLTRFATVDVVLWDDTRIVPCDSQLWVIECTGTTEYATRAGKFT